MYVCEVVRNTLRCKDMIPVLAVGEIIIRKIGSGEDELIVEPIQLDVL